MPKLTFLPLRKTVNVKPGTELLEAALKADVEIPVSCGGDGTCGKCLVRIDSGEVDFTSSGILSRIEKSEGYVLACKTRVLDKPIKVFVPEQIEDKEGKFTDAYDDIGLVRQELFPKNWQFDPLAVKWVVDVPPPKPEDGLSDLDRLTRRLQLEWGKKEFFFPLSILRQLADTLRLEDGKVTVTLVRESDRYHVVGIEPGDRTFRHYGIAIDIGTTTVAVQLVFQRLPKAIATRTDYNDQIKCGLDIISRINYAKRPERLAELRLLVLKTINRLIKKASTSQKIKTEEICSAVISGNTTMIHLLLGLNPDYIRLDPYTPTILNTPNLSAVDIGIDINPKSWIYISPGVGSYVGGDITAGLLCTDLASDTEDINLFIDIGTNGEIVVGNSDFLIGCACSAGPAFEGGGIEDGMRASLGAIERVEVDPETGIASYSTIGKVKPRGICGTGMISLLANLLLTGWIDFAGKLNRTRACRVISISGRHAIYTIVPSEESDTLKPINISELDVENIIRAKAAIYSASSLLLEQIGIRFEDIANIYIAGGFGRFLDLKMATVIGLIPDLPVEKFKYIGNASLIGSYMILVSQDYKEKQLKLANRMTYIDLGKDPNYMNQYTAALFLPHTDLDSFPSVKPLMKIKT